MSGQNEPDEPVTQTADTVAAPGDKPTESADLAWSLDTQEQETPGHRWRGRLTSAALVTLLCAIVAVVTWFAITLYHQNDSRPPASAPASSAVAPAPKPAPPPPPPPVTVTAMPAPAPALSATDQAFLADVQHAGLYYSDPAYPIAHARALCNWITANPDKANGFTVSYVEDSTIWTDSDSATNFIIAVVPHYCPQFNSGIGR
jgi:hypothetical protein